MGHLGERRRLRDEQLKDAQEIQIKKKKKNGFLLSFFRFGCWKGFASFLKGTMWRKKIRQKKRTLKRESEVSVRIYCLICLFFSMCPFSYYLSPPSSSSSSIISLPLLSFHIIVMPDWP